MDLFHIERFGVETQEEDRIKEQQKIFQQRIEKRKSLKRNLEVKSSTKKKKKSKIDTSDRESGTEEEVTRENDNSERKKKKKKKNHEDSFDQESVNEEANEKNDNVDSERKKKKKIRDVEDESEICKEDTETHDKKKKKKKKVQDETSDKDSHDGKIESINQSVNVNGATVEEEQSLGTKENGRNSEEIFPILHKHQHTSKMKLKRNLPRWLAEPIVMKPDQVILEDVNYLAINSVENLKTIDISHLFPVQSNVVPVILEMHKQKKVCFPCRDVCVQSPTGSGKTLSYVLPIIEILSKNMIRELQCLVILPSKDLAAQVKRTFDQCVLGTKLKVGLITGTKSFAKEQETIVMSRPSGHYSLVDILVATPGHLVDHLKLTPGFTLSSLRFLVIDEADRMLSENYDNWLELSKKSIYSSSNGENLYPLTAARFSKPIHHVQKFLFSATLTENPEKLAALDLFNPLLFLTQSGLEIHDPEQENHVKKYVVPEQLQEKMLVVDTYQKPMALLHIVLAYDYKCVLCFANSIESTHRLYLLLKQFDGVNAAEFSSSLNETQRRGVLRDFRDGKLNLLIATDAMSRGMDIKNVDLVVNYDAPINAKTYVHRVGRTARGGDEGEAITILVSKEVYHYKRMRKSLTTTKKLQTFSIPNKTFSCYEEKYETSLQELKNKLQSEKKKF